MSATRTTEAMKGFDTNSKLTATTAILFREQGYDFVLRYVPRLVHHANDLTLQEAAVIRAVGLGLQIVQHVESETAWVPSADKGSAYGDMAASECEAIGYAPGCSVWLDLEAVQLGVPASEVIAYCNRWHDAVHERGFAPGVYVGWRCGLTPEQLYRRLKFRAYWSAWNLNIDEYPIVRGVQMHQREVRAGDVPTGVGIAIDVDFVGGDALGGFPVMDR